MNQTLMGYIDNPMGKGSVMNQKKLIQGQYEQKYGQVMLKENGNLKCFLFQPTKHDVYYIHIRVPSESTAKIYYDVVIEFRPSSSESKGESSLRNYYVRFYANDPAFVYTYANAFKSKDLFIKQLSSKMSLLAIRKAAEIRNPNANVGYVKSIYFAYLYMKDHNLLNKALYTTTGIPFNMTDLKGNVAHSDDKMKEVNEATAEQRKKKKAERFKKAEDTRNKTDKVSKPVAKTPVVKKTKTVQTVRKVKTIKSKK
jgi:hypothetical protein